MLKGLRKFLYVEICVVIGVKDTSTNLIVPDEALEIREKNKTENDKNNF